MKRRSIKKIILPNLPYLFIALFATKLPQAWRLAAGADASEKLLHLLGSLAGAFRSPFPSFHPLDLLCYAPCGGLHQSKAFTRYGDT